MKKNILIAALAALTLSFTACQKDDVNPVDNGGVNNNARVKTTSDLHNTYWTYTVTTAEFLNNLGIDTTYLQGLDNETMSFGLNFDGTYAHFTFPVNANALGDNEDDLNQLSGVSYTYSYDGATHTGYLNGVAEDENGNMVPTQLQFTYDDATDIITFELDMFYAEDNTPLTLTLNFARN